MMAPDQTALIALLLLFATAALEVCGRVCYVTQNLNRATKRSSWSLTEERPCECTKFRLGGVNMNPHGKQLDGIPVLVNEQGQIHVPSLNCTGTTFNGTSLCAQNTFQLIGDKERHVLMTSPVRLKFTANVKVSVYLSPNGPGFDEALYSIELDVDSVTFLERENSTQRWTTQGASGKYIGVPVIIRNDNGRFKVAVQGVEGSTLTSIVITTPKPSWFVTFMTLTDAEFIFSEPCINDFSP